MRKCLSIFCLLAMLLTTSMAFASYLVVTSDQIAITSEGIFVTVDGMPVPVESLNLANDGYIVAIPRPNADICPNCGHNTYTKGRFCRRCGFPDDSKKQLSHASIH